MRYLIGFLCVCALAGTLPLSASAQAGQEVTTSEPNLQEFAPSSEPAPEEPALQLKLDSAGVEVVTSPPWAAERYMLQETERRVRRAKIGLGVSVVSFVAGLVMVGAAAANVTPVVCLGDCPPAPDWTLGVGATGAILMAGGFAGTIISAVNLSSGKREQRSLEPPRPDEEPARTEPARLRGPSYRPH